MAWSNSELPEIAKARLLTASPDCVYEALSERAEFIKKNRYGSGIDETLDRSLFDRNDSHVTLALAYFSPDCVLLSQIYDKAAAIEPASEYSIGVRAACLANEPAGKPIWDDAGLWLQDRIRDLVSAPVGAELKALLRNPMAGKALGMMLQKTGWFSDADNSKWIELVQLGSENPRLNIDDDDESGPDMTRWDLEKGVANVVMNAPVDIRSFWVVSGLLGKLNPYFWSYSRIDLKLALERWSGLEYDHKGDEEYTDSGLSFHHEFLCYMAVVFGKRLQDGQTVIAGTSDSDSIFLRCAYYGNASLKPEEIKSGIARDGRAFAYAALCNVSILGTRKLRAELEQLMPGGMWDYYKRRGAQYKERWPRFDPTPVSELEIDLLEDAPASLPQSMQSDEFRHLQPAVRDLSSKLANLRAIVIWGIVGFGIYFLFVR